MTDYWIGGYTRGHDEHGGIRRLAGHDAPVTAVTSDPSFLLPSPEHAGLIYAVDEGGNAIVAVRGGAVVARQPTAGVAPCHLAVVADGRVLLAACYGDGAVSAHALDPDGLPGPGRALPAPAPAPNGPHQAQDGPHAHCTLEIDGLVLVADLGTDRVLVYAREAEWFRPDGAIALPPGAGPRDLLVTPSGAVLVLGEHDARIHVLDLAGRRVASSVPTTSDPVRGDQAAGMTLVGDRLTAGLRGSDRIALLSLGPNDVPEPVDSALTGGSWPRHHVVDGERLLVANERSGTITELPFRSPTSLGTPGPVARVPAPTFLLPVGSGR